MTIKVTDEVVAAAIGGAETWVKVLVEGMRAALESFVARHPELAPQRAMHEPVSAPEILEMAAAAAAVVPGEFFFEREERMRAAGNALLARRAAPVIEPVVVTEEMITACIDARARHVDSTSPPTHLTAFVMRWMADHLNSKHETKPVDPRVAVFTKAMVERGYDLGSVEDFEFILAKLDNAKT